MQIISNHYLNSITGIYLYI